MSNTVPHTPAGYGPHQLMLGSITVSRLLAGEQTDGNFALVELRGHPGSGPGAHVDPWRESFYVLEGELTFRIEPDTPSEKSVIARAGDALSIPSGVGHAFTTTGSKPAHYLILGTPSGIEHFFADAGTPIDDATLPATPLADFDHERLLSAFAKHNLTPCGVSGERT